MKEFENNIKEKLESRRETPSDEAWLNISKSLETKSTQQYKRKFWTIAVAASFIGVLITVGLFNFEFEQNNSPVVNSPENTELDNQEHNEFTNPKVEVVNTLKPKAKIDFRLQLPKSNSKITTYAVIEKAEMSKENLSKAERLLSEVEQDLSETEAEEELLAEVEHLLAKAKSNLDSDTDRKIMNKINPETLLAEIDPNSSMNFKDLILKKIEDNYKELRSSFTAR